VIARRCGEAVVLAKGGLGSICRDRAVSAIPGRSSPRRGARWQPVTKRLRPDRYRSCLAARFIPTERHGSCDAPSAEVTIDDLALVSSRAFGCRKPLWVPRRSSAAATRTFGATVPAARMPLWCTRSSTWRSFAWPSLSASRAALRTIWRSRSSCCATRWRCCAARSTDPLCGPLPGAARRAVGTSPTSPSRGLLRPAGHAAALAPRPHLPTLDLPTPSVRSTHGPRGRLLPRRPVGS